MNVLSVQSHVVLGHVGNSAAVFPMQRLGHEVWAINTVQFSNHPGYGGWTGRVFDAGAIDELVDGLAARGALAQCDAVLSGYMGAAETGEAVLRTVARVRDANPRAIYCCDPVIGDTGPGVYVRPGIPELMRERAVPAADIVTPNRFELEFLAGCPARTIAETVRAVGALRALGPSVALVTSLELAETPAGSIDLAAADPDGTWLLRTPRLGLDVNGAGDAIAALFLVHYGEGRSARVALERAASSIYGVLLRTAEAGSREILTVAAQEEFVRPTRSFTAEPI